MLALLSALPWAEILICCKRRDAWIDDCLAKTKPCKFNGDRLVCLQGLSQADQILRLHANDASMGAVDVRDEIKSDGHHNR